MRCDLDTQKKQEGFKSRCSAKRSHEPELPNNHQVLQRWLEYSEHALTVVPFPPFPPQVLLLLPYTYLGFLIIDSSICVAVTTGFPAMFARRIMYF